LGVNRKSGADEFFLLGVAKADVRRTAMTAKKKGGNTVGCAQKLAGLPSKETDRSFNRMSNRA
jgi:hypothetical protein